MSNHQKQVILRWFDEVWNHGRRHVIDEMLPAEFVIHEGEEATQGPEGFKTFFDRMHAAFSDIHVTTHEVVSEADYTFVRWSVTMRHSGDGLGMPATGREVRTTGMTLARFKDGKLVEAWQNWDMLGLHWQIKSPEPTGLYVAGR